MNEYLKVFQLVTQSSELLLEDKSKSLEAQQMATRLRESVQPCVEELKQSATRLNGLVHSCFDDLYYAEEVWLSKPRIADVSKAKIWEQLGELSGRDVRIRKLEERCKAEAITQVRQSWEKRATRFKKKWFWDQKYKLYRESKIFFEKDNLIQQLRLELIEQSKELEIILGNQLKFLHEELLNMNLITMVDCIERFNEKSKKEWKYKLELTANEITNRFEEPTKYMPNYYVKNFLETILNPLAILYSKSILGVSLGDLESLEETVKNILENIIIGLFEDLLKLMLQAIDQAISFYHHFLETQARYQQETPAQRQAEKLWIEDQRQLLALVQAGIERIINPSADY